MQKEAKNLRFKTLQWSCLVLGFLYIFGALARHIAIKLQPAGLVTALGCGSLLIFLGICVKTRKIGLPLGGAFFSGIIFFSLISFSFYGPGFLAPVMSLTLLIPIFAGFVAGRNSTIIAGSAAAVLLVSIYYLHQNKIFSPVVLLPDELMLARLIVLISILLAAVLTSFAYEHSHKILLDLLRERNKELEDANERMNRLVGSVTHDLRNPIGAIQGLTELLAERTRNDDQAARYLKSIETSAECSMEMIESLLQTSAMRSGKICLNYSRFSVAHLVRESWANIEFRAVKKHVRHVIFPGDNIELEADRNRLGQVLVNLYSNAIKFTYADTKIETRISSSDRNVVITVTDYGAGISPAHLGDIFSMEKATSKPGTDGEVGTGYGLPLVKQIVELHGGKILVRSVEGKGTSFDVCIPLNHSQSSDVILNDSQMPGDRKSDQRFALSRYSA